MNRRSWAWGARLAISVALAVWLVRRYDLAAELGNLGADLRPGWLLVTVAVYALSVLGGALQWGWLLRSGGVPAPAGTVLRLYLVGLFFNNFLPANVGGDAVKVVELGRRSGRTAAVLGATLLDRLLGLGALALVGLAATLAAARAGVARLPLLPLALVLGGILLLLALLLAPGLAGAGDRLRRLVPWAAVRDRLARLDATLRERGDRPGQLLQVAALALPVQLLRVATHGLAALALGLPLDAARWLALFALVPLLGVLITLPVTVNGIGLRETAAADLFTTAGITAGGAAAVAVEVTAFAAQVLVSLAGGVLFLLSGGGPQTGEDGNR